MADLNCTSIQSSLVMKLLWPVVTAWLVPKKTPNVAFMHCNYSLALLHLLGKNPFLFRTLLGSVVVRLP